MAAKLKKEQVRLFIAIGVASGAGSAVVRSLDDTTSTWLAVLIGSAVAVVAALAAVGLMSLFDRRATMDVPGLGDVTKDKFGPYYSRPIPVPMFGGKQCRVVLEDYDKDERKEDFHVAVANFLSGSPAVLREADEPLFRYYKDFEEWWLEDGNQPINSADELWQHVQLGSEPMVTRRRYGDKGVYISVECGCDWEEEHGLQLVLKNGAKVSKLGGYDGHLTNSDAFGDDNLEQVVYPTR